MIVFQNSVKNHLPKVTKGGFCLIPMCEQWICWGENGLPLDLTRGGTSLPRNYDSKYGDKIRFVMDKKSKKRLEVLRKRLEKLQRQLAGAKRQMDDESEVATLQSEIEQINQEISKLKEG